MARSEVFLLSIVICLLTVFFCEYLIYFSVIKQVSLTFISFHFLRFAKFYFESEFAGDKIVML